MNIKLRITVMNFLEFFIWGSWLISMGTYMGVTLGFTGLQIGAVYATMGIASLFMPGLLGIVADRWLNAEYVMVICHIVVAVSMFFAATATDYSTLYILMLINALAFMPTIALDNSISYYLLEEHGFDIVDDFPPIRVWGTVGFIFAMWVIDFLGWTYTNGQLYVAAGSAVVLAVYMLTMPATPPQDKEEHESWFSAMGLDALVLFKERKMAVFFIFSMLLGAALQITNAFGGPFLASFQDTYPNSFGVQHPNILLSLSQISEVVCILTIPFFLKRYGIKKVMLMSMSAWVLRFAFFGIGNPADLIFLVLSMLVYGVAFDFFNISGSLFIDEEVNKNIRSSAQGLFVIMTNGFGALLGGIASGWVVNYFTVNGVRDWQSIWFVFAGYALILAIIFPFVFKYKHEGDLDVDNIV